MRMNWKICGGSALFSLGILMMLVTGTVAPAHAEICDSEDMPDLIAYQDTLLLPDLDWGMRLFYPEEGTYLDSIVSSHYSLESRFSYFGIPADFDQTEEYPPHFYLPIGWRNSKMITFRWNEPVGHQIIREPLLVAGHFLMPDPAGGAGDSVVVCPGIVLYGEYSGSRDQVFRIEYRQGAHFIGDTVASPNDPQLDAWDVNEWSEYWDPDGYLSAVAEGDTVELSTEIAWSETYVPDEEFAFAPGDEASNGVIELWSRYTRIDGVLILLDSNLECAHEMAYGLYISFTPGVIGDGFRITFVAEDFEGYNVWRRINGSQEWINTWHLSKNEERDKFYWWWISYTKDLVTFELFYEWDTLTPVFGLTNKRVYLDFDVHNGFSYDYALTTFDRGFRPNSGGSAHYILDSTPKSELDTIAGSLIFNFPAAGDLDRSPAVYPVPNPLRTGKSALEDPGYHNFLGEVVRFVGVTDHSEIQVFTVSGDLVFEGGNIDPDTSSIVWDTRNQNGDLVASGVYIYRVEDSDLGQDAYGRLVIIR